MDIEVVCHNGRVGANQIVLAALSPVLREFIQESLLSVCDKPVVVMPDAKVEDIQTFFRSVSLYYW